MTRALTAVLVTAALAACTAAPASGAVSEFATGLTNPRHVRFGPDGNALRRRGRSRRRPAAPPAARSSTTCSRRTGRTSRASPAGSRASCPTGRAQTVADRLPSSTTDSGTASAHRTSRGSAGRCTSSSRAAAARAGFPTIPGRDRADPPRRHVDTWPTSARSSARTPSRASPRAGPTATASPTACRTRCSPGRYLYVVETNHNSVLRVDPRKGTITRVYDLSVQDPAPIILCPRATRSTSAGSTASSRPSTTASGRSRPSTRATARSSSSSSRTGGCTCSRRSPARDAVDPEHRPGHPPRERRKPNDDRRGLDFPIGMAAGADTGTAARLYVSTVGYGQGAVAGRGQDRSGVAQEVTSCSVWTMAANSSWRLVAVARASSSAVITVPSGPVRSNVCVASRTNSTS